MNSEMIRAEYDTYKQMICARVDRAIRVPFRQVSLHGWRPKANDCHANVDTWVHHHPGMTVVRGWIVESPNSLTAHSVVRGDDGRLFDITPFHDENLRLGFVEHPGDDGTFFRMKDVGGVTMPCTVVDLEEQLKEIEKRFGELDWHNPALTRDGNGL